MLCGALIGLGRWSLDQFEKLGARQGPCVGPKGQKPFSTSKATLPLFFYSYFLTHSKTPFPYFQLYFTP